jgi:hypothetical protein
VSRLRELAEQATAAHEGDPVKRAAIQRAKWALDEMSPDLAVLLADAKDALAKHRCRRKSGYALPVTSLDANFRQAGGPQPLPVEACSTCVLLARIEELEGKA